MASLVQPNFLDGDSAARVDSLIGQLERVQFQNQLKANYYFGKQKIKDLGISIPPHLTSLDIAVGWPGTAVDVLDERIELEGWADAGDAHGLEIGRAHV